MEAAATDVPDEVREAWYRHLEDVYGLQHENYNAIIARAYADLGPRLAANPSMQLLGPVVRRHLHCTVGRMFPEEGDLGPFQKVGQGKRETRRRARTGVEDQHNPSQGGETACQTPSTPSSMSGDPPHSQLRHSTRARRPPQPYWRAPPTSTSPASHKGGGQQ